MSIKKGIYSARKFRRFLQKNIASLKEKKEISIEFFARILLAPFQYHCITFINDT